MMIASWVARGQRVQRVVLAPGVFRLLTSSLPAGPDLIDEVHEFDFVAAADLLNPPGLPGALVSYLHLSKSR